MGQSCIDWNLMSEGLQETRKGDRLSVITGCIIIHINSMCRYEINEHVFNITYVVLDSRLIKSSMHQCIKAKNIHYRILDGSMIRSRAIHTCRIAIRTSRDRQFLIKTTSNDTTDTCRSCIGNAKARPVKRQEQDNIFHKYNE